MPGDFMHRRTLQLQLALTEPSRDRGASMTEYALLLVLVFLAAFVSLVFFGDSVVSIFDSGGESFEPKTTPATN